MHETPTARRARLEARFAEEMGRVPRDVDEFLDWYSGYCRRCEADAARFQWLAESLWVQMERRGLVRPSSHIWLASESDLAAWVDRQMAAEPQEVSRVA